MTSLISEVKALEERATKGDEAIALVDRMKALLAGPVQLSIPTPAPCWTCKGCGAQFPSHPFDDGVDRCTKCVEVEILYAARTTTIKHLLRAIGVPEDELHAQLERSRKDEHLAAYVEGFVNPSRFMSTGDGPVSAGVHTLQEAKDEGRREHVEALQRALDRLGAPPPAPTGVKSEILRCEQFVDELRERVAAAEEVRDSIERQVSDEHEVNAKLDTIAGKLLEAGRVEAGDIAGLDPWAMANLIEGAVDALVEDLECANARTPNPSAKDVDLLDRMLTEDPSPWDLSAANRAVLKRLREYVAGPMEKPFTQKVNGNPEATITTETRTDFTSPDIDANPDVDAAQRIAEEQAKPKKKRSKKKVKEPEAPPPDAFTSTGYVITKVSSDGRRFYVMPNASPDHPHSVWCVGKVAARIFETYTEAADERRRLKLKLGEPIPTAMIDDMHGGLAELGKTPEDWSAGRRVVLEDMETNGVAMRLEVAELNARREAESES